MIKEKMDLRIIKTRRAIKDSFIKLRKIKSLDQIKVISICEDALINKSTFYTHYTGIAELNKLIEEEYIKSIYKNFKDIDYLFSDPQRFLKGLISLLQDNKGDLYILFRDNLDSLFKQIEFDIKQYYKIQKGQSEVLLSFIIGGVLHTMKSNSMDTEFVNEKVFDEICVIIEKLNK